MTGGYREDPEEAIQHRQEWIDFAIAGPAAIAVGVAFEYFRDALVASTGLSTNGFSTVRNVVALAVLFFVSRWLERRRTSRSQGP
jgi:hypothetical protein